MSSSDAPVASLMLSMISAGWHGARALASDEQRVERNAQPPKAARAEGAGGRLARRAVGASPMRFPLSSAAAISGRPPKRQPVGELRSGLCLLLRGGCACQRLPGRCRGGWQAGQRWGPRTWPLMAFGLALDGAPACPHPPIQLQLTLGRHRRAGPARSLLDGRHGVCVWRAGGADRGAMVQ